MNKTPRGERLHIGIFGKRNAGKSSLLNAITGQDAAVVSHVKGTTTDPVYKSMELLPIGPVVLTDTAGIDDDGMLGDARIEKAKKTLRKTDVALLVIDATSGPDSYDNDLITTFEEMGIKYLIVYNKSDLINGDKLTTNTQTNHERQAAATTPPTISVSATSGTNIHELKELIAQIGTAQNTTRKLIADLLAPSDIVILVIPIDSAAPKGRLILPQQQVIRDTLDRGANCLVTGPQNLSTTLQNLITPPKLVVTDSQIFAEVAKQVPSSIGLTSFSILMARYKGVLDGAVASVKVIDNLKSGDKVLIAEGCTHHRSCEDIGTVKIPRWIESRTGAKPSYTFSSGEGFPGDITGYKLIIHCGGCMQNPREMQYRQSVAKTAGVPMTNYGIAISYMQGILERCVAPLVKS